MERKIKIKVIFLFALIFFVSFVELLGVAVIYPIVNLIMDDNYAENIWCKAVMNITGIAEREPVMIIIIGAAMLVYVFKSLYLSWMYGQLYKMSATIKENMAVKLMKAYMRQPYSFFLKINTFGRMSLI